jgi:hypothetical protein
MSHPGSALPEDFELPREVLQNKMTGFLDSRNCGIISDDDSAPAPAHACLPRRFPWSQAENSVLTGFSGNYLVGWPFHPFVL